MPSKETLPQHLTANISRCAGYKNFEAHLVYFLTVGLLLQEAGMSQASSCGDKYTGPSFGSNFYYLLSLQDG